MQKQTIFFGFVILLAAAALPDSASSQDAPPVQKQKSFSATGELIVGIGEDFVDSILGGLVYTHGGPTPF